MESLKLTYYKVFDKLGGSLLAIVSSSDFCRYHEQKQKFLRCSPRNMAEAQYILIDNKFYRTVWFSEEPKSLENQ